jgi:hypothetical protein
MDFGHGNAFSPRYVFGVKYGKIIAPYWAAGVFVRLVLQVFASERNPEESDLEI